ncbi:MULTISPECIES: hypothetical protein [unclassified Streptomyces]|uniref:hypothetical protein n=1 Tax=unclassified Streptomyces TaxID=2593676 RepID=UPI003D8FAB82
MNRHLIIALSFMEYHGTDQDGRPRTFTPDELKAVANHFTVPNQGPHSEAGAAVVNRWTWTSPAASAAFPRQYMTLAEGGERFRCADHGCPCGWSYTYAPGEPMAVPAEVPAV